MLITAEDLLPNESHATADVSLLKLFTATLNVYYVTCTFKFQMLMDLRVVAVKTEKCLV